ncbi:hypothetical protein GCK32_012554 [Trichostrongylus colubriformis]|uniref:HAT C-terminal dimerisation domain-containing protein n=1 Tax=Trichostrongylus colubriformis TaxID=6319 RepID=A0AAN8FGY1_TRICO
MSEDLLAGTTRLRGEQKQFRSLNDLSSMSTEGFTQRQDDPSELLTASDLVRAVQAHIVNFYNTVAGAVRKLITWPTNFRDEKTSVRFYQTLHNEGDSLEIPNLVPQAIKCILVIPASNADPERSFSTINRLTKGERSNLGTETLDNVMMIHRNGPSVLTIQPRNLAHQWMKPLPGLQLQNYLPSTLERTDSLMKQVKDSIVEDDAPTLKSRNAFVWTTRLSLVGLRKEDSCLKLQIGKILSTTTEVPSRCTLRYSSTSNQTQESLNDAYEILIADVFLIDKVEDTDAQSGFPVMEPTVWFYIDDINLNVYKAMTAILTANEFPGMEQKSVNLFICCFATMYADGVKIYSSVVSPEDGVALQRAIDHVAVWSTD